jgi:hypothetical protein
LFRAIFVIQKTSQKGFSDLYSRIHMQNLPKLRTAPPLAVKGRHPGLISTAPGQYCPPTCTHTYSRSKVCRGGQPRLEGRGQRTAAAPPATTRPSTRPAHRCAGPRAEARASHCARQIVWGWPTFRPLIEILDQNAERSRAVRAGPVKLPSLRASGFRLDHTELVPPLHLRGRL